MPDAFELPRRAMAIFAHPDDVDFGCSGTVALWTAKGVHVTYCLLTSGNKGTHDARMTAERIAAIREKEQQEAGRRAGASEFVFLRHDDGELEVGMDLRGEVCRQIRIHKPDLVFCQDPWREYQVHPDHRVAGWSALDGVIAARDAEGRRLAEVITDQLAAAERLVHTIAASPARTVAAVAARLGEQVQKLLAASGNALDPARLHQEAALLATRIDVEEELKRLTSHVAAARDLLAAKEPVGRKFDFLTQEFNREANTLCSKANDPEITRAGLELKAVIDQMREQVQNIE